MSQSSVAQGFSPTIVGIGGTTRPGSTSERTLIKALEAAERQGATTRLFGGAFLSKLPIYDPSTADSSAELGELLDTIRTADGVLIATPGYHGSVSGLIKNALDSLEGLSKDVRPYFEGRAVGCIVTADGWQACGTTLAALRTIIHALRGWPTPL
ncbi:MAG TPA: NADPH-dependent FMN reductase, partial [Caulobacteraceae bacterium]|nr:NADPH-dependent FMN reductase [Caulobacteraceae bacterium]